MSEEKKKSSVNVRIIKAYEQPIEKAETSVRLDKDDQNSEWIGHGVVLDNLKNMVMDSTILPQCIRAYRQNIAGFGIGVRYKEEKNPTPEMVAEKNKMEEIIELLNFDCDTKECFEQIIESRECYGIAYLEIIRNGFGEVVEVNVIEHTPSITKSKKDNNFVETSFFFNGQEQKRRKRFRRYKQSIGSKTVYFKEFGDPRIMDNRNGKFVSEGETLEDEYIANEILEFKVGQGPYGEVRWFGQILNIDGSRRAEQLNNNYFKNGRHTPLLIAVNGGTISDESFKKLQTYMNDIKGEKGQHQFLLLETEKFSSETGFDNDQKPEIEVKDLASMLQKDELFQDYSENSRKKVQSSFQLPDIYVAYTTDFNRATAISAMKVTEQQVFQPERFSLAWVINNRLLNAYNFKYVEAYFLEPDLSNPDDIYKILTAANNAGGVTPNRAKSILDDILNETSEAFESEWGDIPVSVYQSMNQSAINGLQQAIEKAENAKDTEVVNIMKEVKSLLIATQDGEIYE